WAGPGEKLVPKAELGNARGEALLPGQTRRLVRAVGGPSSECPPASGPESVQEFASRALRAARAKTAWRGRSFFTPAPAPPVNEINPGLSGNNRNVRILGTVEMSAGQPLSLLPLERLAPGMFLGWTVPPRAAILAGAVGRIGLRRS